MNCRFISSRLSAFIDRELDLFEYARVAEHVEKCLRCREELEEIRAIKRRIASLPECLPPADFQKRLLELCRIGEGDVFPWRSGLFRAPSPRLTVFGAAVVASAAVAAAVLLFQLQNSSPRFPDDLEVVKGVPGITEADQALDQRRNPLSGMPVSYSPEFVSR